MGLSSEQFVVEVMSGNRQGAAAVALRGLMSAIEPVYRAVVGWRNRRFDRGVGVRRLPRPVISVGNITAGGTGKTPVVRWLCEKLAAEGRQPAVLLRGYKSSGGVSDEEAMLREYLGDSIPVVANPDRYAGGCEALKRSPNIDVFVLDDGFQHRKLARDFDLVLIDAGRPFGFEHVHPRGLLRESLKGLERADAILITRSDEVDAGKLQCIEERVQRFSDAPIFRAMHRHRGFVNQKNELVEASALAGVPFFAFCAIGNAQSFFRQLESAGLTLAGSQAFADHHRYRDEEVRAVLTAKDAGGLMTTQKDWVKLRGLLAVKECAKPIWRAELGVGFVADDEDAMFNVIWRKCWENGPSDSAARSIRS